MMLDDAVRTFGTACNWPSGSIKVATRRLKKYQVGERMDWHDAAFGFGIPLEDATGLLVYLTARGFLKQISFARCYACMPTWDEGEEIEKQYFDHDWEKYLHPRCRFCGAELSPGRDFDAEYEKVTDTTEGVS